uniref:C3H1-type domain-containing protein n=1 Tax=Nyssomyia neivai TaxID=330878 RepID=A0A1L8DCD2_9DIPT
MEGDEKTIPQDDADLEDGEIETDDEDVVPDKPTKDVEIPKNATQNEVRSENKSNDTAPVDEWAVRVEKAIANVLKKDGIEVAEPSERPSPVRTVPGPSQKRVRDLGGRNGAEELSKNARRRKRKREDAKEAKRKTPKGEGKDESVDDYEMLCIRGGSPPRREYDNESEHSYSSYSSYDSGDYRRQRKRPRDRRRGGGGGSASGKHFDKRRQHHDSDNESRHPRKMELCKFYLMDCCAKREKCLYMHSDFPCKYYYLGLNCINRETCKFSHGRPLSNQLRNILLKHLETAPKEILGDFPRLGRDHAVNMLNLTHKKLMGEHEEADTKNQKPRKSRWCGEARKSKQQPKEDVLSLKHLTNVLTQDQIERMATMGIDTLDQVQHLTFMQLTELGLSFQQLSEIQLNTMNFQKLGIVKGAEKGEEKDSEEKESKDKEDAPATKEEEVEKIVDVDMRKIEQMEIASPDHEEHNIKKEQIVCNFHSPSPEVGDQGNNPDEPKLLIDESWYSDEEPPKVPETKSPSDTESYWPPKPAVVEASDVSRVVGGSLAKIDYTSQILPKEPTPEPTPEPPAPTRDPRQSRETASGDKGSTRPSIYDQVPSTVEDATVGDQDMRLPIFGNIEISHVDGSTRDVDLRLPFKPLMTNYVPATEIDASLASHAPFPYKVVVCDIPSPDYRELRKRPPTTQGNTQDPRLRRILSLRDAEEEAEPIATDTPRAPAAAATVNLDPRRKHDDVPKSAPPGGIDIQQVLQKSPWYKDLGSKNKIMVNQQLALLSAELKRFASDATPSKIFDMTVVTYNPTLAHILHQLGICLGENGQFTLVEETQSNQRLMDWMQQQQQQQQQPIRPNFMPQTRPPLLGGPPIRPPGPFDGPPFFNNPPMPDFFNQPPPGDINRPPRPPFRGRSDRWSGRPQRRHFDSSRSGRRDKPPKN